MKRAINTMQTKSMILSVIGFITLGLLHAVATSEHAYAQQKRPNIVLFLVDDMGIMDTSVPFLTDNLGRVKRYPLNEFYRTPNMERLAASGIRFNQFCAMSVCSPTRISLMTGQNAARHHTTNWINPDKDNRGPLGPPQWNWKGLDRKSVTLPRLLQAAGYSTIHVGKGHFGPRKSEGEDPRNIGYEVNVGGCSIGQPASYYGKKNYGNAGGDQKETSPTAVPHLEAYHGTDTFLSDALTMEALRHVKSAVDEDKPFFLSLAHYAVHAPFNSDPRFAANYQSSDKPKQAQAFATLIEGMDKSLGDLLDGLDKLGVAEKTLIIFLGDNGSDAPLGEPHVVACAAPLRGKKGSHYEGGMRVPFIASWGKLAPKNPLQREWKIASGSIQTQQAAVFDIFPTVLELAGIVAPVDHTVDGNTFKTLLRGESDPERPQSFLMHYPHAVHRTDYFTSLREGDWKLVYHYFPTKVSDNSHYQLFHLVDDPFESKEVSATEPKKLQHMMRRMVEELQKHNALLPLDSEGGKPLELVMPGL